MYSDIDEIQSELRLGKSVVDIVNHYLLRIEQQKHLNAFVEVFEESARTSAHEIDQKIKAGTAGPLAGLVLGIKDNICYKGHQVSASSQILQNFESLYTATCLQRLIDQDAIVIGRLNCDEFAMGSSNEKSFYGPVRNVHNEAYVPGGSSGGSAVAVAAGLCTAALGSDTGGSVRQPASWTDTVGFKPTYGRISRYGLIAYASSFDQIGVFSQSIKDTQTLYEIMAGKDAMDATSSSLEVQEAPITLKNLRFGVIKDYLNHPQLDPEVHAHLVELISRLEQAGHTITYFDFPYLAYVVPVYYVLTTAEASSNLSRFDGVHFGYRSNDAFGTDEVYTKSRSEGFGEEVKRRIITGTFVLSNEQYEAYYAKGQKVRRLLQDHTRQMFEQADCLIMPTTPSTAFKIGEVKDPITMYLQDIYTVHANLTGNPAISLPYTFHTNGLPFGVQLMTDNFNESLLFHASAIVKNSLV